MDMTDDILQEAFLRFLRADHSQMDEQQMRGYLYRAANSLIIDDWRRQQRQARQYEDLIRRDTMTDSQSGDEMKHAFGQLKPQQRSLLWLAYVEDFDHQEIAATVGVKAKSVRVLLFRARKALMVILKRAGIGPEVA
jgi:RNA polymerase sigma-70 factor (ECF subfamily)